MTYCNWTPFIRLIADWCTNVKQKDDSTHLPTGTCAAYETADAKLHRREQRTLLKANNEVRTTQSLIRNPKKKGKLDTRQFDVGDWCVATLFNISVHLSIDYGSDQSYRYSSPESTAYSLA